MYSFEDSSKQSDSSMYVQTKKHGLLTAEDRGAGGR